ncbi:acetyl esterase [Mycetocola sp. CAN_C7]|uniref:alpha/beta hydrolase n=1 Tax=Mycetocola sp. CAN_C7 TaxID=2787724 RepID=UPI001A2B3FB8
MPLDPYFRDMYLARRRDMIAEARGAITGFVASIVPWRTDAAGPVASSTTPSKTPRPPKATMPGADTSAETTGTVGTAASGTAAAGARSPAGQKAAQKSLSPEEKARRRTPAWKRRNAKKWDTKLYGRVGQTPPEVEIIDFRVDVPRFPSVRVRVYRPAGTTGEPLPAVLAFFGGSFQLGGVDYTSVDATFRMRTADARVVHVAVDYALAPEHRYPTQIEQGYASLDWLFTTANELGIDRDRIGINGTSSGGNIAAAVTLVNRDRADHPLRLQILEVPVTDLTGSSVDFAPIREMRIPGFLARRELVQVVDAYLGDRARARQPYASPLHAGNHRGLPPAYILTSEYDALRRDGEAYAAALRASGVEASAVRYQGATHEAAMYTKVVPLARRWHADVVAALATLYGSGSHAGRM